MTRAKSLQRLMVLLLVVAVAAAAFPLALAHSAGPSPLAGEAVRGELNGWSTWAMTGSLGGTFIHTTG